MRCSGCDHENQADALFCEECGSALETPCPQCGQKLRPGSKFCRKCGHRLTGAAPAAPVPPSAPRVQSPQQYTPKHLAEKILTARSALEGERKQVTVLFCDVAGSTALAERLDPEVMHEVMDRALRLMAEAVHRYEGTVNQFLGDGLMALFGAPIALEDHAVRAVQAALAIQETINGYSEHLKRERGVEVRLRLGLNTGLVVVGRIGDDLRMDYTAIGDTTNLAARMQSLAEPGTILITEATHRLAEGYIQSEALGPVQVKGRSEPVSVYKVTGHRRGRTRLEISLERGLTPLVGRQRELDLLQSCLARARTGRGQVVGVVGEPGVGKSRLVYEFRRSLEEEPLTWLAGHCVAYSQATPYLPILDLLRASFHLEEDDTQLQIQEKLREGLRQPDTVLEAAFPFLGELFGVPGEDDTLRKLDPKDKRQKTFEAIRAFLATRTQRRPHVVILENLHWIDKTSEDWLGFLIESLAGLPVLLLTSYRPGYAVRWADKTYFTQITLDHLTEQETEAMVATLLGSQELPPDLVRLIWEKAEGNSLFIEEVARSLQERGVLVQGDDTVRWAKDAMVELPGTVQDIIRARIDRLEEPVKRTVQTASVIGREFDLRLITRISDVAGEVHRYLDILKHLELIHEKRFFPELEYIFKHAVTQDVAYQSLLVQKRKELHGSIAAAIEGLYADRLGEHAAVLAYHCARSESPERAIEYALLAGDKAAGLYANAEARTYYEQALTIARDLPPSPSARHAEIDATLRLAGVALTREHFEQDLAHLERAHTVAGEIGDQRRTAQALYWMARIHYVRGNLENAVEFLEKSLAVAESLQDEALIVWPVNLIGRIYVATGDYLKAKSALQRSVQLLEPLGNQSELATASSILGIVLAATGDFQQAVKFVEQGLQIVRESQNLPGEAASYYYRALVYEQKGEWAKLVEECHAGLEIARRIPDPFRVYALTSVLGHALFRLGEAERGIESLREGIRLAGELGTTLLLAWADARGSASRTWPRGTSRRHRPGPPGPFLSRGREATSTARAWRHAATGKPSAGKIRAGWPRRRSTSGGPSGSRRRRG